MPDTAPAGGKEGAMPKYYNKQGPGGIDWCDYTFNPIAGCKHDCEYCYARRIADRFRGGAFPFGFVPTFYLDRLLAPAPKKPSRIFVGSMGDLCGNWKWEVAEYDNARFLSWMVQAMVRNYCVKNKHHQYIILTKNPGGLCVPRETGQLPANIVFGVSVPGGGEAEEQRLKKLRIIQKRGYTPRVVVSYEPALTPLPELWSVEDDTGWLIIGAQTGPGAEPVGARHVRNAAGMAMKLGWRVWVKGNVIKQHPKWVEMVDSGGFASGMWLEQEQEEPWPQEHLSMPMADDA